MSTARAASTNDWIRGMMARVMLMSNPALPSVPSGPILNVKDVFENDQVQHLGLAVPVSSPKLGDLKVQRVPSTLSRTPGSVRMPTPESGEHNDEILKTLGYSADDIARLRKEEII